MKTISYAVTVCNEHEELERLLKQLISIIEPSDEIVIQTDQDNVTQQVLDVIQKYQDKVKVVSFSLNKNFADFKNNLKKNCSKDYIFFIDADEYLSQDLSELIKEFLVLNTDFDCFAIPRVNTVEGLTYQHIQKWGWRVDEKGWVNFPDYQMRICKNKEEINWVSPVHERLIGYKQMTTIPYDQDVQLHLVHPKTIDRQEKQNLLYESI